ncbi:MAG: metallophosphoesterase, partial [Dehalococcoidia bacterium]|nr:metallophosphoesterase [Dehalococcoidia bacterium]
GDLCQHPLTGDPDDARRDAPAAAYRHLRELIEQELAPFGAPILLGLGNHDGRAAFRAEFLGETTASDTPYYYRQVVAGVRVLMLDSKLTGYDHGYLGQGQLDWLRAELNVAHSGPSLIVLHHPPILGGPASPSDAVFLLQNEDALRAAIADKTLVGILSGHTHQHAYGRFAGHLVATTTGVAFTLEPTVDGAFGFVAASGYNVCVIKDNQLVVNPVLLPWNGLQTLYRAPLTAQVSPQE